MAAPRAAFSHPAHAPRMVSRPAPQMHVQQRQQLRVQRQEQRIQSRQQNAKQNVPQPNAKTLQGNAQQLNRRQTLANEKRQIRDLQSTQRQQLHAKNLTPAQRRDLRAQQAKQLQDLRTQQRAQRQLATQPLMQQQNQQQQQAQGLRRNGQPRLTEDAARRGRFASNALNNANNPNWQARRAAFAAARAPVWDAWRHKRRPIFVAWFGPVFFPYAYSDIFNYTFWPYAYDDDYWAYAYDDFVDSMFWAEASPYSDYAYYGPSPRNYTRYGGSYTTATTGVAPSGGGAPSGGAAPQRNPALAQICGDPGKGITAWPFAQIEQAVRPNDAQKQLLDNVKRAAADAAEAFKASCGQNYPLTPPGRLAAMTSRLEATLQAVRTVRPPLEAFYDSLNDEQKARFTAIGPDLGSGRGQAPRNAQQQAANNCDANKPGLTNLPMERIEDAVKPTQQQQGAFDQLDQATGKAVQILAAACPDDVPLTPTGRLEAMEKRLAAMVDAGKTVQPALDAFYASLSNEQKARFNTLGQQAERGG